MLSPREVAPNALGEMLKDQPISAAKVEFAWLSSVGTAISKATSVRLDHSGTLNVTAGTEAWRREVTRSIPLIKKKLGTLLGTKTVKRIRVRQRGHK